ncbi:bifunctional 4-hydroxy-2-oxoglutarate aldolase/2-dehydro-3-deoxy-phosphogluconate aldolase [Labrys monachus]|uniref:2-dehydro-3-deoxyphosphogluconate aldolase/(4S)-4-hydroxy-2-oxoglutarate aldolase n=1 Tax=Labrys monachus TaxID=217067 RepID=A0ABU0FBT9_9HYPH|nr:keto-deoxy-phosphogluconate aldolase [Labrys monachus]MDQ0392081.1 2-dehydro-3-deoxyphosphogluconate aldolase/(4S)-4-hydroxy-2-oxoglutarate aldolase [Labrys monachus]
MTSQDMEARLRRVGVVPIIVPRSVAFCLDVIGPLAEGGAEGIEIVMRTREALPAVEAARKAFPDLLIGVGTVMTPEQYDAAVAAGAAFAICPGFPPVLAEHVRRSGPIPFVPGTVTPTEVMTAQRAGFDILKFYPSGPSGGTATLGDYGNVFPKARFMPSGKIGLDDLPDYGSLANIVSVGGSWMYMNGDRPFERAEIVARMRRSREAMRGAFAISTT